MAAAGEHSDPRGTLTITAPVAAGELALRSIIAKFMRLHRRYASGFTCWTGWPT